MDNNLIRNLQIKPRRKRRKRWIWLLLFIIAGIVAVLVIPNKSKRELISPLVNTHIDNSLKNAVENVLVGTKGNYGIAIKNLKTGESYYSSERKVFEAGSLYKLWIMATVFKQIQDEKLTKDQVLSEDVAVLNQKFDIDPELVELSKGMVTFTVSDALLQMITISHNYAALLLTEKIKLSTVAAFLKANEFQESTVGTEGTAPTSTPSNIALFYEKLYRGELANQQYTQEMIDLLKNQKLNDGLPKYLPDQSKVAHKTGDISWFKHDAGIVYTEKGDYIIVIMSESDSPSGAQERISLISKAVYEYFMR